MLKPKTEFKIIPYHPTWDITDGSKLKTYLECPRHYFYEYILGWRPETPSNHLVFGSAWHLAMEHLLLNGYDPDSVAEAYQLFLAEYRKTFSPETDQLYAPKTPEIAELVLYAYAANYSKDLERYEVLHTEIAGVVALTEDRQLHFRMDSIIRERETGMIYSLEHKTGSRLWRWEEQWPLSIQVGTYTHVLYCLYPAEIVRGIIVNGSFFTKAPRSWEAWLNGDRSKYKPPFDFMRVPVYRSTDQMQTWLWGTTAWLDLLEWDFQSLLTQDQNAPFMSCFPMNPTSCTNYLGCPFKDFCSAWPNPLQHCEEPPMGFVVDRWDPSAEPAKTVFNLNAKGEVDNGHELS